MSFKIFEDLFTVIKHYSKMWLRFIVFVQNNVWETPPGFGSETKQMLYKMLVQFM